MKLNQTALFVAMVAASILSWGTQSFAQNKPLTCEIRWFCHDIGMPSAEDETSRFISVFLTSNDASPVPHLSEESTYDYGESIPAIQWSNDCERFQTQMQDFFKIDSKTECVRIHPDGSYVVSWP